MRKLLFLLVLSACAAQRQPTEQQLAVLAYYANQCEKQGINTNDERLLRGCVLSLYNRDVASGVYGRGPTLGDALQSYGSVYGAGVRPTCTTRPDYAGGWITTCN